MRPKHFGHRMIAAILIAAIQLLAGCASRYRVDLWYVSNTDRSRIEVEETAYAVDTRLNDPMDSPQVAAGDQSTVVISLGMRGNPIEGAPTDLGLGFDEYLKYRLYLELPPAPLDHADTIALAGHSYVRQMKFYERPPAEKTFLPHGDGRFIIDSVKSGNLFGSFEEAVWENNKGLRIGLEGQVKVKVR